MIFAVLSNSSGIDVLNRKSELKKEMEKRKEAQKKKELEEHQRLKRTSFEKKLEEQAIKLEAVSYPGYCAIIKKMFLGGASSKNSKLTKLFYKLGSF